MREFEEQTLIILAKIEESLEKSRKRNRQVIEEYPARKAKWDKMRRGI